MNVLGRSTGAVMVNTILNAVCPATIVGNNVGAARSVCAIVGAVSLNKVVSSPVFVEYDPYALMTG